MYHPAISLVMQNKMALSSLIASICLSPPMILNGNRTVTSLQEGGIATYTCKIGSQLIGTSDLRCQNGTWSGSPPQCLGK